MLDSTQTPLRTNQRQSFHADDWTQKQSSVFAQYVDQVHSVLQYGCGDGELLRTVASSIQAGIEREPTLAAAAAKKGIDVQRNASGFAGRTFDRIFFGNDIGDLPNPVQILGELRPLLAETGLLLLSQPIDTERVSQPSKPQATSARLHQILTQAGYTTDEISIKRHSYRSAGFQFRTNESAKSDLRKTYWMVKPFLSLVAVARKTL